MLKKLYYKLDPLLSKFRILFLKDILLFCVIVIAIDISWEWWEQYNGNTIMGKNITLPFDQIINKGLAGTSDFILKNIFDFKIRTSKVEDGYYIIYNIDYNATFLLSRPCAGLKQFFMYVVLILVFPGTIRRKMLLLASGIAAIALFRIIWINVFCLALVYDFKHYVYYHEMQKYLYLTIIFFFWVLYSYKQKCIHSKRG